MAKNVARRHEKFPAAEKKRDNVSALNKLATFRISLNPTASNSTAPIMAHRAQTLQLLNTAMPLEGFLIERNIALSRESVF